MIVDVSEAFDEWLGSYTLTRKTKSYSSGRVVVGSSEIIPFEGVIQIATPDDKIVLEEGNRDDEAIKIHSTSPIFKDDVVSYDSNEWLVFNIADRKIGNYIKAIAVRKSR